ncbi:hypothetical protein ACQP1O_27245 [Nocardia sp. CA-151230]|uniref:hypothetical protein n=1 Tax=Nocardia sp. CA-151230 TaxID=3239982 RepID=UPI003D91CE86
MTESTVVSRHARHLRRGESQGVTQDQDGHLARRQQLQGRHERQRNGLGLLETAFRAQRLS